MSESINWDLMHFHCLALSDEARVPRCVHMCVQTLQVAESSQAMTVRLSRELINAIKELLVLLLHCNCGLRSSCEREREIAITTLREMDKKLYTLCAAALINLLCKRRTTNVEVNFLLNRTPARISININ